jgi:glycosyltransferase involved in cell wall biosynthesis
MRILFVADGRSPIALDWLEYFVEKGDEVHLASTFPAQPELRLASCRLIPVAFSILKSEMAGEPALLRSTNRLWGASGLRLRTLVRRWLAPFTFPSAASRLRRIVEEARPDLVHAMRIPYEGMVAAEALGNEGDPPLVVSVWGNDFTLHAPATPWMARQTRRCLVRIQGLHVDCQRDLRLAYGWGYPEGGPAIVAPGNGGVKTDLFYPPREGTPQRELTLINPRGFRAYVRNDAFFKAMPHIIERWPQLKILCPDMAGEPQAIRWVRDLGLGNNVELLPKLSRLEMAEAFRRAAISVSPTTHDGTPNTLLEAMACGCLPIAGDLESVREWITPGTNGLLVDPEDPRSIADATTRALVDSRLRSTAQEVNRRLITERAENQKVMAEVERFYRFIQAKS